MNIVSMDGLLKDLYPQPGSRIKQWVVEDRAVRAWERDTCPRYAVPAHDCDDGVQCPSSGCTQFIDILHAECDSCSELADKLRAAPEVAAWWAEYRTRHDSITADHSLLSDEIAPPLANMRENPFFAAVKRNPIPRYKP